MRRLFAALTAACLASALGAGAAGAAPKQDHDRGKGAIVDAQILAFNDFHGNLEPPRGDLGGVEYLDTHLERLETENRKATTIVSTGDLIGGSPLLSALFHDEPAVEAANLMGVDLNAVGNHEFDEGWRELLRMQQGGCHPEDGCLDGDGYEGADFPFLAANVVREDTGETLFPPYVIQKERGERIAYVGVVLEGTPQIVSPQGVEGLEFRDEAETINALVPELRRKGVETIVAVMHEGGRQGETGGGPNECRGGLQGPARDIVDDTDREVDVFLTAHTHQAYDCVVDGRPVISGASNGTYVSDVDLRISKRTGDVLSAQTRNVPVTRDVPKDEQQTQLIAEYAEKAEPIASRVIGSTSAPITREPTPAGESALGDVIADAQLAATQAQGAQVAFMNPGGIRADLDAGEVTYGEAFTVQPFSNSLVTMTLTGTQIDALLEQQFTAAGTKVLQVSEGFAYAYDPSTPIGQRVDPASITIGGTPIDAGSAYRVTVNSFLADGGDGFTVLREGTDRVGGDVDVDAFEAYLAARSPVAPGPRDRIRLAG